MFIHVNLAIHSSDLAFLFAFVLLRSSIYEFAMNGFWNYSEKRKMKGYMSGKSDKNTSATAFLPSSAGLSADKAIAKLN